MMAGLWDCGFYYLRLDQKRVRGFRGFIGFRRIFDFYSFKSFLRAIRFTEDSPGENNPIRAIRVQGFPADWTSSFY
jgi:hypothetical protein